MVALNKNTIMIVCGRLTMGGLETVAANVSNYYSGKGWEVVLLSLLNPDEVVFQKIDPRVKIVFFHGVKASPSFFERVMYSGRWVRFIKKTVSQFRPSIIFALTFKIACLVIRANRHFGARVCARELNDPKSKERPWYINFVTDLYVRHADAVIFQTHWEKSCYSRKVQKIGHVVQNPVKKYVDAPEKKRRAIVAVGRYSNIQKRHDLLIKAFSIFVCNHPDFSLEIYGEGPDEQINRKIAEKLGVGDKVIFEGPRKNVLDLIANASCFVLSSDYEGMSNALLEAWLSGVPCVTTDWPGAEEVVTDNSDALICKRGDAVGLAKCMAEIVDHPEFAKGLGEKAKIKRSNFEYFQVMDMYDAVIEGKVKK